MRARSARFARASGATPRELARSTRARASRPAACAARSRARSARGSSRAPGRPRSARRAPSRGPSRSWRRPASVRSSSADADEHRAHRGDRVDAEVGARAVRRAAGGLDLPPGEALVRDDDVEPGRLGDDARVRAAAREHRLDADARVLLVGDGGHHDVARAARRGRRPRRRACRRRRRPSCRSRRGRRRGPSRTSRRVRLAPSRRRRPCRDAPLSISERPPPRPRAVPTTDGRPGAASHDVDVEAGVGHPRGDEARSPPRPRRPARASG